MSRAALLLALCLGLAACATGSLTERVLGGHVQGDAERAVVSGMDSRVDALPLAIAHCARHGRSAQYESRSGGTITFRCVTG